MVAKRLSIQTLQAQDTGTVKLEGRLARWVLKLKLRELDFEVIHRPGQGSIPLVEDLDADQTNGFTKPKTKD